MHYDLEIVLAVTNKGKYGKRLEHFKKHGIKNIQNRNVLLSILAGNEQIDQIDQGWPSKLDIRVVTCNVNHAAAKTNHFYATYKTDDLMATKWLMRVDDDSMTNVDELLKY